MGFHLVSYKCDKCHQVEIGGNEKTHRCPKKDEDVYFNLHEIKTAAFYGKLPKEETENLIYSLNKLFKKL